MDNTAQSQPQTPAPNIAPPTSSFQQPVKKRNNPLMAIVKVFLLFFLGVGLLLGGFYLGIQSQVPSASPTAAIPTPTPTILSPQPEISETVSISPTPASTNTHKVTAGLAGDATAFEPYSIDIPEGWTDARETTVTAGIDKLTLTKSGYSVTIYQAPMGGSECVYEKDAPSEFAQLYTNYADINGKSGQYRRSWTESTGKVITYTICQKSQDQSYSVMSTFGAINVVSPNPATTAMLTEIDGMIASLIKQ